MAGIRFRPLAVLLLIGLISTTCWAGSLAMVRTRTFSASGPTAGLYWLSLPYSYTPPDSNTNSLVDAEDLVQDLQPSDLPRPCTEAAASCAIVRVWRWDSTTGTYASWTGGSSSGTPFQIEPGAGYGIELQAVVGSIEHAITIVGAHDPSFEHSDCHEPGSINLRWIALPPHLSIGTSRGTPDVLDAEDLGQAMGGPDRVYQIRRLNETTGLFESWVVGATYGTPFEIDLSRSYAIDLSCDDLSAPCAQCQWSWLPTHF